MTQAANQAEAEAAQGNATETPQGAQSDSLNNPGKEPNFNERVASAKTPADVQRLISEAVSAGRKTPTEEQSPPAETPAETEKPAEGEQPVETVAEETPATAETAPAVETPVEGEKPAAETADDDEEDGDKPIKNRVRITDFDDVAKLAIGLKKAAHKRGETITLAEAEKRAAAALGVNQSTAANGETAETTASVPTTVEATDAKIKELIALRTKAFKDDLDFAAGDQLTNEIEALREHKLTLREKVAVETTKEQAAYHAAFDAAEKKANALYDFVKQPESAAWKRMAEIDAQLETNQDPLFNAPDKALVIAQMVARELQIAPKSPTAKTAAVKPVAKAPAVVVKKTVLPVVGGESRTSTSTTQGGELTKKINGLRSPAEVEDFIASMTGR